MLKAATANIRMVSKAFRGNASDCKQAAEAQERYQDLNASLEAIDRRWPGAGGRSEESPVFLFSSGWRAGSTLVQRMLMRDSDLLLWGEPFRDSDMLEGMSRQIRPITDEHPMDRDFIDPAEGKNHDLTARWIANFWPPISSLVDGHYAFFEQTFAKPARAWGRSCWGFKEVRSNIDHVRYLRWLYPKARIILLYRNPFNAYASYFQYIGMAYRRWPFEPILTATHFGGMWQEQTSSFIAEAAALRAFPIQYEKLKEPETHQALCDYMGRKLPQVSEMQHIRGDNNKGDYHPGTRYIPRLEQYFLKKAISPLGPTLGYHGLSQKQQ